MFHEKYLDFSFWGWYPQTMARETAKITPLIKTNLNDQIYPILKEMIADQRFNPGGSINVEQLTHELGVSRTPVWEAIRRLEQEGIVVHTPHKGVRVRELTREMALELYGVREALETTAARQGAGRATPQLIARMGKCLEKQAQIVKQEDAVAYSQSDHEFHLLIHEASGNRLLQEILEGLRYRALPLAFRLTPQFAEFLGYHRLVLEAFKKKDGPGAEKAIRRHNLRMIELIETNPWGNADQ
jgi:DNA-binding GntR family transcriptional regulator